MSQIIPAINGYTEDGLYLVLLLTATDGTPPQGSMQGSLTKLAIFYI